MTLLPLLSAVFPCPLSNSLSFRLDCRDTSIGHYHTRYYHCHTSLQAFHLQRRSFRFLSHLPPPPPSSLPITLRLEGNDLGDKGAAAVAHALELNHALKMLV